MGGEDGRGRESEREGARETRALSQAPAQSFACMRARQHNCHTFTPLSGSPTRARPSERAHTPRAPRIQCARLPGSLRCASAALGNWWRRCGRALVDGACAALAPRRRSARRAAEPRPPPAARRERKPVHVPLTPACLRVGTLPARFGAARAHARTHARSRVRRTQTRARACERTRCTHHAHARTHARTRARAPLGAVYGRTAARARSVGCAALGRTAVVEGIVRALETRGSADDRRVRACVRAAVCAAHTVRFACARLFVCVSVSLFDCLFVCSRVPRARAAGGSTRPRSTHCWTCADRSVRSKNNAHELRSFVQTTTRMNGVRSFKQQRA